MYKGVIAVAMGVAFAAMTASAQVVFSDDFESDTAARPARVFADHMVLQRGEAVPVFGTDTPGQSITVQFGGQTKVTTADSNGDWRVDLDPMAASMTGRTLTVTGSSVVLFADVLVGEVWVAAGQSNMRFTVNESSNTPHPENYGRIRMCNWEPTVGTGGGTVYGPADYANLTPENFYIGTWEVLNSGNVGPQSAVAYFFANALARELAGTGPGGIDVPVGVVELAIGGTSTESFISPAAHQPDPYLKAAFEDPRGVRTLGNWTSGRISKNLTGYVHADPANPHPHPYAPGFLYYTGIANIAPFACKGAIWYQGESNAEFTVAPYKWNGDRLSDYETDVMTALVDSWRTEFGKPDLPFYMVQLPRISASSRALWPWYREAQNRTAEARDGVEVAVVTEFGINGSNVHPPNKEPVGERLAYIARNKQYGENISCSGPVYCSQEISESKIILHFDHVEDGLISSDGMALRHFEISGSERVFVTAMATIVGDTVEVSAPVVTEPVAVRYGWHMNIDVNFYNSNSNENLPASPFRTDDWMAAALSPLHPETLH